MPNEGDVVFQPGGFKIYSNEGWLSFGDKSIRVSLSGNKVLVEGVEIGSIDNPTRIGEGIIRELTKELLNE